MGLIDIAPFDTVAPLDGQTCMPRRAVTSDEVQKLGISGGLKVDKIATNGLIGYYTDIRPGFIITNINNEPVASIDDFEETIANANNNVVRLEGFYMNRPNSVYQYAFKMPN